MSYLEYVVAAYAVFAAVLLWDFVSPHLQLRRELHAARRRAPRTMETPVHDAPLSRD